MCILPAAAYSLAVPEEIEPVGQVLTPGVAAHVVADIAVEVRSLLLGWPRVIPPYKPRHPQLHKADPPVVVDPVLPEHVVVAPNDQDAGPNRDWYRGTDDTLLDTSKLIGERACAVPNLRVVVRVIAVDQVVLEERVVLREAWMIWTYLGVLFTLLLYLWAASQSCRFFLEARRIVERFQPAREIVERCNRIAAAHAGEQRRCGAEIEQRVICASVCFLHPVQHARLRALPRGIQQDRGILRARRQLGHRLS